MARAAHLIGAIGIFCAATAVFSLAGQPIEQSRFEPRILLEEPAGDILLESPLPARKPADPEEVQRTLSDPSPERRIAGLEKLRLDLKTLSSELVAQVTKMSGADPEARVRIAALETFGAWIDRDPNFLSRVGEEMAGYIKTSADTKFRARGLKLFYRAAQKHMGLPENLLSSLTELLWKEASEENRALVAKSFVGASGKAIQEALTRLEQAYLGERELAVKRIILSQMLNVGKNRAIEILRRIPGDDPLAAEVQNLLEASAASIR